MYMEPSSDVGCELPFCWVLIWKRKEKKRKNRETIVVRPVARLMLHPYHRSPSFPA